MDAWKNQLSSLSSLSSGLNVNVTSLNDARLKLTQQVKSTAKSIASEFQETAKELRDAHTEFGGRLAAKSGGEEVRFAFPAELNGGAEVGVSEGVSEGVSDQVSKQVSERGMEEDVSVSGEQSLKAATEGGASVDTMAGDVPQSHQTMSDRLAALKEKLQQQKAQSASKELSGAGRDEPGRVDTRQDALEDQPRFHQQSETGRDVKTDPGVREEDGSPDALGRPFQVGVEDQVGDDQGGLGRNSDAREDIRVQDEAARETMFEELRQLKEANAALVAGEQAAKEAAMEAARLAGERLQAAEEEVAAAKEKVKRANEEATMAREEAALVREKLVAGQLSAHSEPMPSSDGPDQGVQPDQSKEIESLKDQLEKLKNQMLATQTAFEDQIEAEVQERVSALTAGMSTSSKARQEDDDQLLADLEIALDKIQEAEKEVAHWKGEAERMRGELGNMQIALDELRYESENAERLRGQVRSAQAEARAMESNVSEALASKEAFEIKAKQALAVADEERRKAFVAREAEGVAKQELIALQIAYNDMKTKIKDIEGGKGVMKREMVVGVLKDMAGMRHGKAMKHAVERLGLTDAERQQVLGDNSGLASTFVAFLETSVEE